MSHYVSIFLKSKIKNQLTGFVVIMGETGPQIPEETSYSKDFLQNNPSTPTDTQLPPTNQNEHFSDQANTNSESFKRRIPEEELRTKLLMCGSLQVSPDVVEKLLVVVGQVLYIRNSLQVILCVIARCQTTGCQRSRDCCLQSGSQTRYELPCRLVLISPSEELPQLSDEPINVE